MSEDTEEDEDLDPRDLEAFYAAAANDDEFIVQIDFDRTPSIPGLPVGRVQA